MREKHHRILAFFIDIMLVSFLTVCICEVNYANPYLYEYDDALENYNETYNDVSELVNTEEGIDEFIDKITPSLYNLEKKGMFLSIWYLIFYYLYFGVFAYFTKGQTIGKKIFKLKIVDINNEDLSFGKISLRCLINGSSAFLGVNIIALLKLFILLLGPTVSYFALYTILSTFGIVLEMGLIITLLINKENRALNDIIFKTKVIKLK